MFELKNINKGIRRGLLKTPHGEIKTPFFMPVGTVGSVKSVAPWELKELGAQIVLANTYHLYLRPGEKLIKKLGGIHEFMGWDRPILTDSGGYQVFSLGQKRENSGEWGVGRNSSKALPVNHNPKSSLVKISENGVEFKSHLDGSKHFFTPEKVIDIQLDLGVDILMPLDVCPSGKASKEEVEKATMLSVEWAKRAREYFELRIMNYESRKRPLLHGIVQGGLDSKLREWCAKELVKLDFDGYSVGGLAVDFETRNMWDTVKLMGEILPKNKQRYLMGVGTPNDIIKAVNLGMDMFDCVLPTRMARHGNVYVEAKSLSQKAKKGRQKESNFQLVNLLNSGYREDPAVIDNNCGCTACQNGQGFSKAYISHLLRSKEILGIRLATLHNLWQYLNLMKELRVESLN